MVVLVVMACSGPGSPSTATGPTPTSPSSTSSPAITPQGPPVSAVDFSCVLPVYGQVSPHDSAFISFPAGKLTSAKESGYYYDRAVSRWVPVYRQGVSPDGLSYAYTEGWSTSPPKAPRLHIANASTRKDFRVVTMPDAQPYQVVDFTTTAIYLIIAFEGTAPGVWRVDRRTGALAKISSGFYPPTGAAWMAVVDPRDPHPYVSPFSGNAEPNRIDRRDAAGSVNTWFYAPGYALSWVAFAGTPALVVSAFHQESPTAASDHLYWLVEGPGHATRIPFSGEPSELSAGFGSAIADIHGIWLGGPSSLYLVRQSGIVLRVFGSAVQPANGCF